MTNVNIIQTLFEHYSNIIRTLFKHYSNIIQTLFEHYSNIIRTLFNFFHSNISGIYEICKQIINSIKSSFYANFRQQITFLYPAARWGILLG